MNGPTRLRFVDELVGAFVLGCALLFLASLFLAGRAQGWFEKEFVLQTVFPAKGALDLHQNAEVRIQGAMAGRVGDIVPNESGELQTVYILRGRFRNLVRTNSVAVVKKKFQVAGDAFVEITLGDRRFPVMENGATIPSVEDVQLIEKMAEVLEEVRRTMVPMLEEVQGILVNVNTILVAVHEGKGVVGTLLNDEALAARLNAIAEELEKASPQVPVLTAELAEVSVRLKGLMDDVERLAETAVKKVEETDVQPLLAEAEATLKESRLLMQAAVGTMEQTDVQPVLRETEAALRETRRLMETLQRHWLLRKYASGAEGSADSMAPVAIPIGEAGP